MFDIGFQEDVKKILTSVRNASQVYNQLLCFSATLNDMVTEIAEKFMKEDKVIIKSNVKENHIPSTISHYYV
jgi:superfamily II DNA/RNA helicase